MSNFETVIGIEIHIELNTISKMFSSAPNLFHAEPNTNVAFTDIAYPGTLPVVNKAAIAKAIMLAKALEMEIDEQVHFDRKNYFYADLPKGFQITQNLRPIGTNGQLPINEEEIITIERIHLEEDTARSYHDQGQTRLDYNRAGTPLIEIVSEPVLRSAEQASAYIATIRDTARILNISDAKMEEGSLRADINISLRPYGSTKLGTKVEIKNLNSLANVHKAIEKEVSLQTKQYLTGQVITQATKRFDETKQDVITMRTKIDAADYRYFPEPNIPVIQLEKAWIASIDIPELPWEISKKLTELKVAKQDIKQLIIDPAKWAFIKQFESAQMGPVIKLFFAEVIPYLKTSKQEMQTLNLDPKQFKILLTKQQEGAISGAHVKKIINIMLKSNSSVEEIINKHNLKQISDINILKPLLIEIINTNQSFITTNKERPERVNKFILGQMMKVSKGQANPVVVAKLVHDILGV